MASLEAYDPEENYEIKSLLCLGTSNPLRAFCIKLVRATWFNNLSMFFIILNSISMGVADYKHVDRSDYSLLIEGSTRNLINSGILEPIFVAVFTLEMLVKITAKGFICGKKSYLMDSWDRLDFIVVVSALFEFIPGLPQVSFLRAFRLLRPLRTISHFPKMKAMVGALLASIPALMSVVGLLFFVFAVWGILALQFWGRSGYMTSRCRLTPFPVKLLGPENATDGLHQYPLDDTALAAAFHNNQTERCLDVPDNDEAWTKDGSPWAAAQHCAWPLDLDDGRLCSMSGSGGHTCTGGRTCGSNFDMLGNPRFLDEKIVDSALYVEDLNWGYTGFDNMGAAMLTIFQCITLEGWTPVQYMVQDSYNVTLSVLYFTALTLFGGFFLLNMTLAVIEDAYSDQEDQRLEAEAEAEEKAGTIAAAAEASGEPPPGSDEALLDEQIKNRSRCACFYAKQEWATAIVTKPSFDGVITWIILLNTVILALDAHPEDPELKKVCLYIGFMLSLIFICEMGVKIAGLSLAGYLSDSFNCFDCTVVTINLIETILDPPFFLTGQPFTPGSSGGALSALRTFRLFRVLKLLSKLPSLRRLITTVVSMISSVTCFAGLLFLMSYIYALLGMEMFANRLRFDDHGYRIDMSSEGYDTAAEVPRANFDDLLSALTTVFQALTGEDWNALMYTLRRATGTGGWMFVISLQIIGCFIILNLFLAVLLGGFENEDDEEGDDEEELKPKPLNFKKPKPLPKGTLFFCIGPQNFLRKAVAKILYHHYFERLIIILIVVSSMTLAIDNPLNDPSSTLSSDLEQLDYLMTALFILEMLTKILVLGLIGHEGSYLRDGWCILDFLIVMSSIVTMAAGEAAQQLRPLKVLRACRALRPLRMIARYPGMRQVVNALLNSLPGVVNVCILLLLFFLIFAILGVNFFKGTFYSCQGDVFDGLELAKSNLVVHPVAFAALNASQTAWASGSYDGATSKAVCLWLGASWDEVISQNFNNVLNAMFLLFEMGTTEGWVDMMHATTDAVGVDMQPIQDYSRGWCAYSIIFLLLGAFFMLDLFVGVIIDNFNRLRKQEGKSALLTEEQELWRRTEMLMQSMQPRKRPPAPEDPIMHVCYHLTSEAGCENSRASYIFDNCIMFCIIFNTLVMACTAFGQTDDFSRFIETLNNILALVFTGEAVIKLLGVQWRYFDDSWNKFDFLVVCMTDFGLVLEWATGVAIGPIGTAVRAVRILRIIRLVNKAPTLRAVFNALMLTLPSLFNVSSVLFLMYFIYAVLGVQLFAAVQLGDTMNSHANFQNFGTALSLVVRASTGESWNYIMHDAAIDNEGCVANLEYSTAYCTYNNDDGCTPINGCGAGTMSYFYFYSFTLLVSFVFVNLFIAIILEGFADCQELEKDIPGLSRDEFQLFITQWMELDDELSWTLTESELYKFLAQLPEPLGMGVDPAGELPPVEDMEAFKAEMDIHPQSESKKKRLYSYGEVSKKVFAKVVAAQLGTDAQSLNAPSSAVSNEHQRIVV